MRAVPAAALTALQGRRILVVEDEYMIAREIAETLTDVGIDVIGPVPGVGDAMQIIAEERQIDGALLDVNLRSEPVWIVVDALRLRNIPVVLATGYDQDVIPKAYSDLPRREKPVNRQDLLEALAGQFT